MNPKRILVAGIGNIFFGDDAFGCAANLLLAVDGNETCRRLLDAERFCLAIR